MRSPIRSTVTGAALAALAGVQGQAKTGIWQPMTFHDLQTPSSTDPLQTLVWPDVIREANAYVVTQLKRPLRGRNALVTAVSSTYRQGSKTIIVSTISTRGCDNGANDKGAEIEASTCPLRIVTIEGGKVVAVKTATGCYADHADPDLPAKNRGNGSYTRLDPESGTIAFRTRVGGRDVRRCARSYSVE